MAKRKPSRKVLHRARELRERASRSPFWEKNIEELLKSNNELFKGPISHEDMEACYNFVLDCYDPNVQQEEWKWLEDEESEKDDFNMFFSLIELDDRDSITAVMLWETEDRELVARFLSKKYEWKAPAE